MRLPSLLASVALGTTLTAALACGSVVDRENSGVPGTCIGEAPALEPMRTDILFVVDNSNSMREEQEGVATELPEFVRALQAGGGLTQDFRVGLVTTSVYQQAIVPGGIDYRDFSDIGEAGRLRPVPEADGRIRADAPRWIEGTDPELLPKFQRLIQQGTFGSGQETPFEAALLAVTDPLTAIEPDAGGNAGFLRDGARLLVVVVSDEDDCSERARPPAVAVGTDPSRDWCNERAEDLTPVSAYVDAFHALSDTTGARREVLWASIAPVALEDKRAEAVVDGTQLRNVGCPTSRGPGLRQREMAEAFDPSLRNLDSICRPSYRESLIAIAAIANENQTVEVRNLPDPGLLQVRITRADGTVQTCTESNGGFTYSPPLREDESGRIHFTAECPRRTDDQSVELMLLCAE
ncbi:MAG TPA: vWA domain-containing protein [Myxococcaceae bacterium]|nr:vWA domain-containing protein [Myxococcaceae bacterium]